MSKTYPQHNMLINLANYCYRGIRKLFRSLKKVIFAPNFQVSKHNYKLIKLGSVYGGWVFIDSDDLYSSTIISCGLGEDASFDIEFSSRFDSKIIIVDPTPRAIDHFREITERTGKTATAAYSDTGKQPLEAYDLTALKSDSLVLIDKALWNESKTLKFFAPPNPNHVSHSVVNYQNNHRTDTPYIEVQAITMDILLQDLGISALPLIKLDVEGAEIEVILDMMTKKIYPTQILIEYDELSTPSRQSKERINSAHNALLKNGYQLINLDAPSNFLYARSAPTFVHFQRK